MNKGADALLRDVVRSIAGLGVLPVHEICSDLKTHLSLAQSWHCEHTIARALTQQEAWGTTPMHVRQSVEALVAQGRMRLALLQWEMETAVEALLERGIPSLAVKGAHLSVAAYPDPLLRPMTDVDLMVPSPEYENAQKVLKEAGFQPLAPKRFRVELSRGASSPVVELHQRLLVDDSPELTRAQWSTAVPSGRGVFWLSSEQNVVYLIRHCAVQHAIESPLWLLDVHFAIMSSPGLSWSLVLQGLKDAGACAAGALVLSIVKNEFGTTVDEDVLAELFGTLSVRRQRGLRSLLHWHSWFQSRARSIGALAHQRMALHDNWGQTWRYVRRKWGF